MSEDKRPDHFRPTVPEGSHGPTSKESDSASPYEAELKRFYCAPAPKPKAKKPDAGPADPELLSAKTAKGIPHIGTTRHEKDPIAYVKIASRDGGVAYYVTEFDPVRNLAYGVIDGFTGRRFAYFSVTELRKRRDIRGMPLVRARWRPQPVSMIRCEGRTLGRGLERGR